MLFKSHKSKNKYLHSKLGNVFVRDFRPTNVAALDINDKFAKHDYNVFLNNELENKRKKHPIIDSEKFVHEKIVIVSDGCDSDKKQDFLATLPKDVTIIAVNGVLAKWKLVGNLHPDKLKKSINYYVVNNPYEECLLNLPKKHSYFPRCIASIRTNYEFINNYRGITYFYEPVSNTYYSGSSRFSDYQIDDYRNPICAAIGLSYRFGVKKLLLYCCDDVFKQHKAGSEEVNGYYVYPQQIIGQSIIDANLYWLKQAGIEIADHSSGLKYEHATYINLNEIVDFFKESNEQ